MCKGGDADPNNNCCGFSKEESIFGVGIKKRLNRNKTWIST
jgi:hypothetical protein